MLKSVEEILVEIVHLRAVILRACAAQERCAAPCCFNSSETKLCEESQIRTGLTDWDYT